MPHTNPSLTNVSHLVTTTIRQVFGGANLKAAAQTPTFPGVFHDVDAELDDVSTEEFARRALLGSLTEPLVVDEGSIATLRVLQEELKR